MKSPGSYSSTGVAGVVASYDLFVRFLLLSLDFDVDLGFFDLYDYDFSSLISAFRSPLPSLRQ